MTSSESKTDLFKSVEHDITHLNPVLVPHEDKYLIFTCSELNWIYLVCFNENGVLKQILFNHEEFGEGFEIGSNKKVRPNGIAVQDKNTGGAYIYSFGRLEYPFLLRYNLSTHDTEDLNIKDKQLGINGKYGISRAAKTCVFGPGDKHILVTSSENELLIYSVVENKFIFKAYKLSQFLDEKEVDEKLKRYFQYTFDSQYLCKINENNSTTDFLMINHLFITFLTIKMKGTTKDRTINVKVRYSINYISGVNKKMKDFGCCYVPESKVLFITGGKSTIGDIMSSAIVLYDVESDSCGRSTIKMPVTLAQHGVTYLPKTRCLHFIGGETYEYGKLNLNIKEFYISIDAFKKEIDILKDWASKNPPKLNNKFSNEIPKTEE